MRRVARWIGTRLVLVLICFSAVGCGAYRAPITYPDPQRTIYYANEVAVAVNMLQHTAIELNKISVCDAGVVATTDPGVAIPVTPVCHPLLSEDNTRVVGEAASDARATLRKAPEGWRATVTAALDRIQARLDNAGQVKLSAYLQAVRFLLGSLP